MAPAAHPQTSQSTVSVRMGFQTSFLLLFLFLSASVVMAEGGATGAAKQEEAAPAAVHIVYTRRPQDADPDVHNVRTLTSVLGSEEAAKQALIYSYTTAASGFAAKLTPQQAEEISRQPDVLHVQPDQPLELAGRGTVDV